MPRLLLAGAGHAHMAVMAAIPHLVSQGHQVTAIGPGERHYYSGMGPGMLGGTYQPEEISFPVREMVESRGGSFIVGKVGAVDPQRHSVTLETGQEVPYDVLSCNLGSHVPEQTVSTDSGTLQDIFPVKPIERLWSARQRIQELTDSRQVRIAVCGGGPAAVEIAGNAWSAGTQRGRYGCVVQLFAGTKLLKNKPENVRRRARNALEKRGIDILEGSYVRSVRHGSIQLANGRQHDQDIIFLALGVRPSPVFRASGLEVSDDGGLLVNRFLQSCSHPDIFGGGDCITFTPQPLAKVGVYAVRQNPVLLRNLHAQLEGRALEPFDPGGDYLLIFNLGNKQGILYKGGVVLGGWLAFRIKDYIDRKFIKEFLPSSSSHSH